MRTRAPTLKSLQNHKITKKKNIIQYSFHIELELSSSLTPFNSKFRDSNYTKVAHSRNSAQLNPRYHRYQSETERDGEG